MPVPYDEPENVVWQTRIDAPPDAYAMALADALEAAFGEGLHDIDGLTRRLNETGPRPAGGGDWTASLLEAELVRLGA